MMSVTCSMLMWKRDASIALESTISPRHKSDVRITSRAFEARIIRGQRARRPSTIGIIAEAFYGPPDRRSPSLPQIDPPFSIPDLPDQYQIQYVPGLGYVKLFVDRAAGQVASSSAQPPQVQRIRAVLTVSAPAARNHLGLVNARTSQLVVEKEDETTPVSGPQPVLYHICAACDRCHSP